MKKFDFMKNIFRKNILFVAITLLVWGLSSCRIGLGEAIDLAAPKVEITSPDPRESVPASFEVTGKASDNTGITKFMLTVGNNTWIYQNGAWTLNGKPYADATWKNIDANNYEWSVRNVSVSQDGEYTIKVSAYDENGNSSKDSVAQRTVVYDMQAPKVTISYPSLYGSLDKIKTELDSYNGPTGYQNYAMLENFVNGSFQITGNQEEAFSLKFLRAYIEDENSNEIWKSKLYVVKESYIDDVIKNNFFTEDEKAAKEYVVTSAIRSFSFDVPNLSEILNIKNKKYLKVVTVSSDASGNIEYEIDKEKPKCFRVSKGFFCYYPQADKPWTEFDMAGDTSDEAYKCYPGTKLQGYSYDDDGIETITATITHPSGAKEEGIILYSRGETDSTTYQTWGLIAPTKDGKYIADIVVTDINGTVSDKKSGWFEVTDINFPNLTINSPDKTKTLFGDKNGNFTFNLTADDDSGISKLLCVYIKNESDVPHYRNKNSEKWNTTSSTTDSKGNKIWYLNLGEPQEVTTAYGKRQVYKKTLDINIFNDLGINGSTSKLKGQHFIFYIEDNSKNALTYDYAIKGDTETPSIAFTTLSVNGNTREISKMITKQMDILDGVNIVLRGTFSDDSMTAWQNPSIFSKFTVVWNNTTLPITKTYTSGKNGTWESSFVYSSAFAEGSEIVSLTANIADYAGNEATQKASFPIDPKTAVLDKITSTNVDGAYAENAKITIVLKFTKNVTVSGGTPTLTLNNGGTATYKEGSGTRDLKFEYTVLPNHDTLKLNVTEIKLNGATLKDGTEPVKAPNAAAATSGKINLADKKSIEIITKAPEFKNAKFSKSGTKDILELEFSANVRKKAGIITLTQTDATLTKVPAVLTEEEFRTWNNADSSTNLLTYYTRSTNGASKAGAADLTTKYVLNYNLDSDNGTLLASYKKANQHIISIDVMSSYVTTNAQNVKVELSDSYALPCKGASYTVRVPAGLIVNAVGTPSDKTSTPTIAHDGVEAPVIRVNKGKATFNTTAKTATQPMQSKFKIDCETTGATIKYETSKLDFPFEGKDGLKAQTVLQTQDGKAYAAEPTSGGMPDTNITPTTAHTEKSTHDIGDPSWKKGGQKIFIAASATKGSASANAYEMAYRSVFVFDEQSGNYAGGAEGEIRLKDLGTDARVWIRGGDSETGPVTTAGFPLSWNEKDYNGVALLTKADTSKDFGQWYYVTWELSTTAYIGVIAGVADANSGTQGPKEWSFGKNAWVPFKKWYPLFPGESRLTEAEKYASVRGQYRGAFGFKKTTVDRNGKEKSYETSGTAGGGGGGTDGTFEMYTSETQTVPTASIVSGGSAGQYFALNLKVDSDDTFKEITINATFKTNKGDKPVELVKGWSETPYNGQTFSVNLKLEDGMTVTGVEYKCKFKFNPWISEDPTLTFDASTEISGGSNTNYGGTAVSGYGTNGEILKRQMDFSANSWAEYGISFKEFREAHEGSQIVITVATKSGWQVGANCNDKQLVETNGSWCNYNKDNGGGNASITNSGGTCTITKTLSAAEAADLKICDMTIKGNGCTITSVKLLN